MTKFFMFLTLCATLLSCTESHERTLENNSGDTTKPETELVQKNDFEITHITRKDFIPSYRFEGLTSFVFDFDIVNNTENSINHFIMDVHIEVTYQDGTVEIRPDERLPSSLSSVVFSSNNANSNWQPHKSLTFNTEQPDKGEIGYFMFKNEEFNRTPIQVKADCKYKAVSIDGEFEGQIEIDLLAEWKECQQKLGLR